MTLRKIVLSTKSLAGACRFYGVSEDWFHKWGAHLRKRPRVESLKSKSRKPYRSPNRTKPRIEKKVVALRRAEPSYGPERLSHEANELFGMKVAPSTVYAILRRTKMISRAIAKRLTKKHLRRYRRPVPGFLQMDFKYVPYPINGAQLYQLSCIDHHSSWRMIRIYRQKDLSCVVLFLKELIKTCPFPIFEIQTDNDAAFTDRFSSGRGVTGEADTQQGCCETD